jgi:hypothetical protein
MLIFKLFKKCNSATQWRYIDASTKVAKFVFGWGYAKSILTKKCMDFQMTCTTSGMLNHTDFWICVSHMSKLPTLQILAMQLMFAQCFVFMFGMT